MQGVLRNRGHEWGHEQPDRDTRGQEVEELRAREQPLHDVRADEPQREEPHHDARHARERLQHRLEHAAGARLRELREVERGPEPEGSRHEHRDQRYHDAPGEDRGEPELLTTGEPVEHEHLRQVDLREVVDRPARQGEHDRDADRHREQRGAQEHRANDLLPTVPLRAARQIRQGQPRPLDARLHHAASVVAGELDPATCELYQGPRAPRKGPGAIAPRPVPTVVPGSPSRPPPPTPTGWRRSGPRAG